MIGIGDYDLKTIRHFDRVGLRLSNIYGNEFH
jgi:hypothetical protein